jgi:hypothetical protein
MIHGKSKPASLMTIIEHCFIMPQQKWSQRGGKLQLELQLEEADELSCDIESCAT